MDLLTEASRGTRVVAVRHISPEQSPPDTNNAINTTLLCHSYSIHPDFDSYYNALQSYAWLLWSCGLIVFIAVWAVYVVTMRSAFRHWPDHKVRVAVVLSVYPMVAGAAFIAIIVPRARVMAEALAQEAVMIAMYHFFCLLIAECGGPEQLVIRAAGSHLETRVLPCCCWPCCVIPQPKVVKKNLVRLRYIVLQMPVIQALLYIMILIIWTEDFMTYHKNLVYFQPFVAASILSGVWGVIISVRTVTTLGYNPKPRFLAVQLVLIIVKLQCGLAKLVADVAPLPCVVRLHPTVFVNLIHNSIMMLEMLLISVCAWRLYSIPPGKDLDKVQKVVVVLDDACDIKSFKDGIDNMSFNNNVTVIN